MEQVEKFKLGLNLPTDPRWVNLAEISLEEILIDHAYCEQKAASSCISMIVSFSDYSEVVDTITPIVSEEWGHFQRVLKELKKRGFVLGRKRADEYVARLTKLEIKGGSREQQLMEKCLQNAMIEARSCERFRLLSLHIEDEGLKKFYKELMISEAGHYKTFLKLAKIYNDESIVMSRWNELLQQEAEIISTLEVRGDRMH